MYLELSAYSDIMVCDLPCYCSNILLFLCADNWYGLQHGFMLWYSEQQGSHIDDHWPPTLGCTVPHPCPDLTEPSKVHIE